MHAELMHGERLFEWTNFALRKIALSLEPICDMLGKRL
jgi:hypothetical protein